MISHILQPHQFETPAARICQQSIKAQAPFQTRGVSIKQENEDPVLRLRAHKGDFPAQIQHIQHKEIRHTDFKFRKRQSSTTISPKAPTPKKPGLATDERIAWVHHYRNHPIKAPKIQRTPTQVEMAMRLHAEMSQQRPRRRFHWRRIITCNCCP